MEVINLGLVSYQESLEHQKRVLSKVQAGGADTVIFCQHPMTITLGRKSREANLLASRAELERQGFFVLPADRGGDVTLHAPGQLVVYPVMNLRRKSLGLKEYLRQLEKTAVDLLADFGIVAAGDDGNRGVWVEGRKIASIGIGVSKWVTYHGLALNVNNDLQLFKVMRPCGLDVEMTSVAVELKHPVVIDKVMERYGYHCSRSW